jgi:hypothetical protein
LFESGRAADDGSIRVNDDDADGDAFEPHYEEIVSGDQVQIYEPIILDHAGHVTTALLSAVRYAKDNRLLPEGFDESTGGRRRPGPRSGRGGRRPHRRGGHRPLSRLPR